MWRQDKLSQGFSLPRVCFLSFFPVPSLLQWFHALFVEIPAYVMLGCGGLYMAMGILCMRPVRDRCREDYARRMEEYFETREALQRSLPPFEG